MRNAIYIIILMLLVSGCAHAPVRQDKPEPQPLPQKQVSQPEPSLTQKETSEEELTTQVNQLIEKLASNDFRERENAKKKLAGFLVSNPSKTLGYLKRAYNKTTDPEVRESLRSMLELYSYWGISPAILDAIPDIFERLAEGKQLKETINILRKMKSEDKNALLFSIARRYSGYDLRAVDALVENANKEVIDFFINRLVLDCENADSDPIDLGDTDEDEIEDDVEFIDYALMRLGYRAVPYLSEVLSKAKNSTLAGRAARIVAYCGKEGETALLSELQNRNPLAKEEVLWSILNNTNIIPPFEILTMLIKEEKPGIRVNAAKIIGLVKEKKAAEILIKMLKDENWNVQYAAALTLAARGDKRAVPFIESEFWNMYDERWQAIHALGRIRDYSIIRPLFQAFKDPSNSVACAAIEQMNKLGDRCLPELKRLWRSNDPYIRICALDWIEKLTENKQDLIPIYVEALKDMDSKIRSQAIRGLGELGCTEFYDIFMAGLNNPDLGIKAESTYALGKIGDKRAVEALIPLLKHKELRVRNSAAIALGEIGGTKALDALIPQLEEEDFSIQSNAAFALGILKDKRAAEPLLKKLENTNSSIRWYSIKALVLIGDISSLIKALQSKDEDVQKEAARALQTIGVTAVPALIKTLNDADGKLCGKVVPILAAIGDERAYKPLLKMLTKEKFVKGLPYALMKTGGTNATTYLSEAIRNSVWVQDAIQIVEFGEDALGLLWEIVNTCNGRFRNEALNALALLRDRKAFDLMLKELNESKRLIYMDSLMLYRDNRLADVLASRLETDERAVDFLAELGDRRAVKPLIREVIETKDKTGRHCAVYDLTDLKDDAALEPLKAMLLEDNRKDRLEAARALEIFKDACAVDALINALKDDDPAVGDAAAHSLGEIGDKRAIPALMNVRTTDEVAAAIRKFHPPETVDFFLSMIEDDNLMTGRRDFLRSSTMMIDSSCGKFWDGRGNIIDSTLTAIFTLAEINDKRAIEPLRNLLESELDSIRLAAAVALLRFGDKKAEEMTENALRDKKGDIQYYALCALIECPNGKALPRLIEMLGSDEAVSRNQVVKALGAFGGRQASDALIAELNKTEYYFDQIYAIEALAGLKDKKAVSPLIKILQSHPNVIARQKSEKALQEITGQNFGWNWQAWRRWYEANKEK